MRPQLESEMTHLVIDEFLLINFSAAHRLTRVFFICPVGNKLRQLTSLR